MTDNKLKSWYVCLTAFYSSFTGFFSALDLRPYLIRLIRVIIELLATCFVVRDLD